MSLVKLQVKNIVALGLWDKVCEYKEWNPYLINEGNINEEEWVEFDDEFNKDSEHNEKIKKVLINNKIVHIKFNEHESFRISRIIRLHDKLYMIDNYDELEDLYHGEELYFLDVDEI